MQKFATQAVRVMLGLVVAANSTAAAVSSSPEFSKFEPAAAITSAVSMTGVSVDTRGGLARSPNPRNDPSHVATPASGNDTVVMLIAAMAIMGVVVRRRWDSR